MHGNKVEVLYSPNNVDALQNCFDFYLDKIKEFDYCLGVDADEFLSVPSRTIKKWLADCNYPKMIGLPWLNISYVGGPVGDYSDMLRTGVISPRNIGKCIFETKHITGVRPHYPIFDVESDRSMHKPKISWVISKRGLEKNSAVISGLRQVEQLHRTSAKVITNPEASAHPRTEFSEFCFIVHFSIRGAVDLVTKTLFQNFADETKRNNLTNSTLFESSDFSAVTLEGLPSRFIYAFEEIRLKVLSSDCANEMRKITAERLGSLPLALEVQKRFLFEGLAKIGVDHNRAEKIWNSDFMERLFQNLDDRFGGQFTPEPSIVKKNQQFLLERLRQFFDGSIASHKQFDQQARKALKAAHNKFESSGLDGEELIDAIITQARARLERNFPRAT
jgi:hypothetical protein